MELSGEEFVPCEREEVWAALTDPDVLRRCIPGCTSLVREDEHHYSLEVVFKVGPAQPRFSGKMTIEDPDYPQAYTLKAFGKDGSASDAIGQALLALQPATGEDAGGTRLSYRMLIEISGSLARIGEKLIHVVARRMVLTFFRRFQEIVRPIGGTTGDQSTSEEMQQIIDRALRGGDWQP